MTLSAVEFLRRFLLHVLPKGFVRIRRCGWWTNRHGQRQLDRCRDLFDEGRTPGKADAADTGILFRFMLFGKFEQLFVVRRRPHVGMHVGDEQVQLAVVVEIEDLSADRAPRDASQDAFCHVLESAVPLIVIELAGAEHIGDQNVHAAVPVVIEHGDVSAPAPTRPDFSVIFVNVPSPLL